ncbi:MAG: DapH/DapD/GlmU-related protein [Acidimicrobiales bacterium]
MLGTGGHATAVGAALGHPIDGYVGPDQSVTDADLLRRDPSQILLIHGLGFQGERVNLRRVLYERYVAAGFEFVTVRHPMAIVDDRATAYPGSQILIGAILVAGSVIETNSIVNSGAVVDHDSRVGAHSHIGPGAVLCGNVTVGVSTFIGAGAVVLPGVTIGDGSVVGAGAVVTRDVPSAVQVVGVPAIQQGGSR